MDLTEGSIAVVTGAASGIGLQLCRQLAERGMTVAMLDIQRGALIAAAQTLRDAGANVYEFTVDVGNGAAMEAIAKQVRQELGAPSLLCNNAGVFSGGLLWECSEADYEWLMRVNQWGVINGIRSFLPAMVEAGTEAHVVNVSSMAGLTTMPFAGIYHMTKHAVLSLSECLFHELALTAPHVGVSCACPEAFATGIAASERNRPTALAEHALGDARDMVHQALEDSTAAGQAPAVMAARILDAVESGQFYVLAPEEDSWSASARVRLEDIASGRNPTFAPPL